MNAELLAAEQLGSETIRKAGTMLLNFYGRTTAHEKGRHDLVTEADIAIEGYILGALEKRFPQWQAISEERTAKGAETLKQYCWVLDPVDGTVNFASHVPFFCISLALLKNGSPVLGWVYDPLHQELFHARKSAGSFCNSVPLQCRGQSVIMGVDAQFFEWLARSGRELKPLAALQAKLGRTRTYGSQSLALAYVAASRLRCSMTRGCKLWDDAAGALLVQEAGGRYTDFKGRDIFPLFDGSPILAGNALESIAADDAALREIVSVLSE